MRREPIPNPPTEPRLLLTVHEVAHLLGLGVRTVWRLSSAGELPAPLSIGRAKRWERKAIEIYIASKRAERRNQK